MDGFPFNEDNPIITPNTEVATQFHVMLTAFMGVGFTRAEAFEMVLLAWETALEHMND